MHPFARSPGGYSPGSGPTGPAEGLATRCAFPLIRTDAPHLKLMNGRLLLKMVNGAGYSRFVGAADRQFNQYRVTALVKLRSARGNQRTAIYGQVLPSNQSADRSVGNECMIR